MRVLHLYCHPLPESFHGALRAAALAGLARVGRLRWFVAPGAPIRYHALYHLNVASNTDREAFLRRVGQRMERF